MFLKTSFSFPRNSIFNNKMFHDLTKQKDVLFPVTFDLKKRENIFGTQFNARIRYSIKIEY